MFKLYHLSRVILYQTLPPPPQIAELAALREQLAEQTRLHVRELAKKEAEKEIILDDHEALSDQYQCLTMTFESQSVRLTEAEVGVVLAELGITVGHWSFFLEQKLK